MAPPPPAPRWRSRPGGGSPLRPSRRRRQTRSPPTRSSARTVAYFAYGTTQRGFAHHRRLHDLLGEPVARCHTVAPHAVVVPRQAACSNPGCSYVHRMAVLVPGFAPLHATGDVFLIGDEAVEVIDRLETSTAEAAGPYARASVPVAAFDGHASWMAQAYVAREPARWRALVARDGAEALPVYGRELADDVRDKDCCVRAPGHAPPHDVVDPLVSTG